MKSVTRVLSVAIGVAVTLGTAFVQVPSAEALSATAKTKFITSLVSAAQKTQRAFGVPASVSIAQAIVASSWGTSSVVEKAKNYFDTPCSASMTSTQFAKLAVDQVGKPYVLGAEAAISNPDPAKFDCSELVEWLYGRSGNKITDLAASQYNVTSKVSSGDTPKSGDLVFLRNNPARSNGIGHVAVVTKKKSDGDWEVVEARGRAYGVVRTTLSYWKQRSYYAGMRRYSKFVLVNGESVTASAAGMWKSSCLTIGSTKYSTFSSMANSFYANAAAITEDASYEKAREVLTNVPKLVKAVAKVAMPKDSDDYAATLQNLIDTYHLTDYDIVPITIVLDSGDEGSRVTALQYLLKAAGYSAGTSGSFDKTTVSAVKKFQKAKDLEVDGEAGYYTLTSLFASLSSGDTGNRPRALNALLAGLGFDTGGADFDAATVAAVKSFQATAGRNPSGSVDKNTWSALFMALDSVKPKVSGTTRVAQTLTADPGDWGPGTVSLSYQWYRDGAAISGAEAATYTLQATDAGKRVTVVVTGAKSGYTVTARTSDASAEIVPNTFTKAPQPTISGTPQVGKKLTATAGTWEPAPVALAYQWLRDGKEISGATKSAYIVQVADVDAQLTVTVIGTKAGYVTAAKTSEKTEKVAKGTMVGHTPTISGPRRVGEKLTAIRGSWSPSGLKVSYQWYSGNDPVKGATGKTWTVTKAARGHTVSVLVTATLAGYEDLAKKSAKTGKIS